MIVFLVKNKIKKAKFNPLLSGGSLVIGQEQDGLGSAGGFFDLQQGWSGKLTQVCFFLSNQMSHLTQS